MHTCGQYRPVLSTFSGCVSLSPPPAHSFFIGPIVINIHRNRESRSRGPVTRVTCHEEEEEEEEFIRIQQIL